MQKKKIIARPVVEYKNARRANVQKPLVPDYKPTLKLNFHDDDNEKIPQCVLYDLLATIEISGRKKEDLHLKKHFFDQISSNVIRRLKPTFSRSAENKNLFNLLKTQVADKLEITYGSDHFSVAKHIVHNEVCKQFLNINPDKRKLVQGLINKQAEDILVETNTDVKRMINLSDSKFGTFLKERGFFAAWDKLSEADRHMLNLKIIKNNLDQKSFHEGLIDEVLGKSTMASQLSI